MKFSAVILAAGKGSRMRSNIPKVLHTLAGKPIVRYLIDTCNKLGAKNIYLVYGHSSELIKKTLFDEPVSWVLQAEPLGTGHAVSQASKKFLGNEKILVLYGDVPLISEETIRKLLNAYPMGGIALLTVFLDNPMGYGRILRRDCDNAVVRIIEEKDATENQKIIKEINTGVMVALGDDLKRWISDLNNKNSQSEYYLTDIVSTAYHEGCQVHTVHPVDKIEVKGINDLVQLTQLEREFQLSQAYKLINQGLILLDPDRFDLRGVLIFGINCKIDINVIIEGNVSLGNNVIVGAGSIIKNCIIDDNTIIKPYSVIEGSSIGKNCKLGPFARLRPTSKLFDNVHIGNFVEVKNVTIGKETKANHLTYLGDAEIGQLSNIGAGVITCNYDGANKHKTILGNDVFVGSSCQLVAPIHIADHATIGAGTTVTKDVAKGELVTRRSKKRTIYNWQRPSKQ
ncbi:bifunctional protein GlmU [Candidatus Photodesmus katoptron]|uniref:bifunctional UDP-N-acetylglucosamine diphosphorylase/glucosamine-1-phosphate N-acetyltransferase GlmU n=1 Tax=Candidatus Photodesmus anomalopis TaxID=28176 RepID=UPI0004D53545|nr:bifunctional UDP-N-acetylglucosamine diphosphorylase/glucosamine-1-phosphate N-acetyltransferase GlmU [Candidatus Photodesmus katoptron]KEY90192.1 bifunctional protein GlmU [Candidatus Photodesmus katoptron]